MSTNVVEKTMEDIIENAIHAHETGPMHQDAASRAAVAQRQPPAPPPDAGYEAMRERAAKAAYEASERFRPYDSAYVPGDKQFAAIVDAVLAECGYVELVAELERAKDGHIESNLYWQRRVDEFGNVASEARAAERARIREAVADLLGNKWPVLPSEVLALIDAEPAAEQSAPVATTHGSVPAAEQRGGTFAAGAAAERARIRGAVIAGVHPGTIKDGHWLECRQVVLAIIDAEPAAEQRGEVKCGPPNDWPCGRAGGYGAMCTHAGCKPHESPTPPDGATGPERVTLWEFDGDWKTTEPMAMPGPNRTPGIDYVRADVTMYKENSRVIRERDTARAALASAESALTATRFAAHTLATDLAAARAAERARIKAWAYSRQNDAPNGRHDLCWNSVLNAMLQFLDAEPAAEPHDEGHPHLIAGEFQSDKYPTCPRGKFPLSFKDPDAQDLLAIYFERHRNRDPQLSEDGFLALKNAGYPKNGNRFADPVQPCSCGKPWSEHTSISYGPGYALVCPVVEPKPTPGQANR